MSVFLDGAPPPPQNLTLCRKAKKTCVFLLSLFSLPLYTERALFASLREPILRFFIVARPGRSRKERETKRERRLLPLSRESILFDCIRFSSPSSFFPLPSPFGVSPFPDSDWLTSPPPPRQLPLRTSAPRPSPSTAASWSSTQRPTPVPAPSATPSAD